MLEKEHILTDNRWCLRVCWQAAVICRQDSILLLIVLEHVIGVPPVWLIWRERGSGAEREFYWWTIKKWDCTTCVNFLTSLTVKCMKAGMDSILCAHKCSISVFVVFVFSPRLYPETQGCQSCGSLLHPRALDLSLCARHWSCCSLLHLWSCLRHTHRIYIYVQQTAIHTYPYTPTQKLTVVYSHMAALSLFMEGSAHASRASATSTHSKGLYGGRGRFTRHTHSQPDMGPTGLGKKSFQRKINWALCLSWP